MVLWPLNGLFHKFKQMGTDRHGLLLTCSMQVKSDTQMHAPVDVITNADYAFERMYGDWDHLHPFFLQLRLGRRHDLYPCYACSKASAIPLWFQIEEES